MNLRNLNRIQDSVDFVHHSTGNVIFDDNIKDVVTQLKKLFPNDYWEWAPDGAFAAVDERSRSHWVEIRRWALEHNCKAENYGEQGWYVIPNENYVPHFVKYRHTEEVDDAAKDWHTAAYKGYKVLYRIKEWGNSEFERESKLNSILNDIQDQIDNINSVIEQTRIDMEEEVAHASEENKDIIGNKYGKKLNLLDKKLTNLNVRKSKYEDKLNNLGHDETRYVKYTDKVYPALSLARAEIFVPRKSDKILEGSPNDYKLEDSKN